MPSTPIVAASLLAAALVTITGSRAALACHSEPCSAQVHPLSALSIAADLAILGLDAHYAGRDARPNRAYGAAEVGLGLIQYVGAAALVLDDGNNYQHVATVQVVAASAVLLHGTYVLIRGGKSAPAERAVSFAPTVSDSGAGLAAFGRF